MTLDGPLEGADTLALPSLFRSGRLLRIYGGPPPQHALTMSHVLHLSLLPTFRTTRIALSAMSASG